MSEDVKSLLLQVDASVELMRRNLNAGISSLGEFERKADQAANSVDAHFQRIDAAAQTATTAIKAFVGAFIVRGVSEFAGQLLNVNREFQQLSAQLVVATGSAEAAASVFDALKDFAATTPYGLNEAVTAFVKLKNLGLDPSIESLRSYGNTAAAMGKGLDQMIEAVADAATGEFERLKEFGIRASKEGERVTFTFQGVAKTVKFSAADIETYLRSIGDLKFGDAMAKQAETLDGKLSNLSDTAAETARILGELGVNEAAIASINFMAGAVESLNLQLRGTAAILNQEGVFGVLFSSRQRLEQAGTALGRKAQLESDVREQQQALRAASARGGRESLNPFVVADFNEARMRLAKARSTLAEFLEENGARLQQERTASLGVMPSSRTAPAQDAPKSAKSAKAKAARAGKEEPWITFEGTAITQEIEQVARDAQRAFDDQMDVSKWISESEVDLLTDQLGAIAKAASKPFDDAQAGAEKIKALLLQGVVYGGNIGTALVNSFKAAAAEAAISGIFDLFKVGSGGGGWLGTAANAALRLFGGGKASGGPVDPSRYYVVGENGPELFVPDAAGTIIPNGGGGGGGGRLVFDLRGAVMTADLLAQMQAMAAQGAITAIGIGRSDMAAARRPRLPRGMGA